MKARPKPKVLIRASEIKLDNEQPLGHPLNPNSEVRGISLTEDTTMERLGVHIVAVTPGKEAFIYHSHTTEEEFMYILSGRGIAEIDDQEYEIGPGDFLAFGTPSVCHHLRNPFDEDLVYLLGREQRDIEISKFPRIGKQIVRIGDRADIIDQQDIRTFWRGDDES